MSIDVFTGPDGIDYPLRHLAPFHYNFEIRRKTGSVTVRLYVTFTDHTYSRDPLPDESREWFLPPVEGKPDRVFCRDRWEFSRGLPQLIRDFLAAGNSACRILDKRNSYVRIERDGLNTFVGWYLFFELERRGGERDLRLTFRSVHHRESLPGNDLGKSPVPIWKLVDLLKP
jgi:hypothetical protein